MLLPRKFVGTITTHGSKANGTSVTTVATFTTHQSWGQIQKTAACRNGALFFHENGIYTLAFAPIILAIISIILTASMRHFTPIDKFPDDVKTAATSSETVAVRAEDEVEAQLPLGEEPPPYQPAATAAPSTTNEAAVTPQAARTTPGKKYTSAERFVIGTLLFILNLITLFLGALSVKALVFCGPWSPQSHFAQFCWWFIYGLVACFASCGAMCWLMLLRNLWGAKVAGRYPIREALVLLVVFGVLVAPVIGTGKGLVWLVRAAQKSWCGVEDEDEDEHEEVELERRGGEDAGEGSSGSGERVDEERLGLMGGMEK